MTGIKIETPQLSLSCRSLVAQELAFIGLSVLLFIRKRLVRG